MYKRKAEAYLAPLSEKLSVPGSIASLVGVILGFGGLILSNSIVGISVTVGIAVIAGVITWFLIKPKKRRRET